MNMSFSNKDKQLHHRHLITADDHSTMQTIYTLMTWVFMGNWALMSLGLNILLCYLLLQL
jgi:hypothetical protein